MTWGMFPAGHHRDYALPPPALLDAMRATGGKVIAVGKVANILAHLGQGLAAHPGLPPLAHDASFLHESTRAQA